MVENRIVVTRSGPTEEQIDVFVLTLRIFIQNNEPTSVYNMKDMYRSLPVSDELKSEFLKTREDFNQYLNHPVPFRVNDQQFDLRYIYETFIWGDLAHANSNKRKQFEEWSRVQRSSKMFEQQFVHILSRLLGFLRQMKEINQQAISELDTLAPAASNEGVKSRRMKLSLGSPE